MVHLIGYRILLIYQCRVSFYYDFDVLFSGLGILHQNLDTTGICKLGDMVSKFYPFQVNA